VGIRVGLMQTKSGRQAIGNVPSYLDSILIHRMNTTICYRQTHLKEYSFPNESRENPLEAGKTTVSGLLATGISLNPNPFT
jgi:hypothetical protein